MNSLRIAAMNSPVKCDARTFFRQRIFTDVFPPLRKRKVGIPAASLGG